MSIFYFFFWRILPKYILKSSTTTTHNTVLRFNSPISYNFWNIKGFMYLCLYDEKKSGIVSKEQRKRTFGRRLNATLIGFSSVLVSNNQRFSWINSKITSESFSLSWSYATEYPVRPFPNFKTTIFGPFSFHIANVQWNVIQHLPPYNISNLCY